MDRRTWTLAAAASALLSALPAHAQAGKTVRWVVPFAAGGPLDVFARKLAELTGPLLQSTIVVENKTGANGSIGTAEVARSAPDGKTFAIALPDSLISVATLLKKPPYDARNDLTPVTQIVASPVVLLASASLQVGSMAEMMSKARHARLAYGSWGPGTTPHLVMASIEAQSSASFTHVPYRGAAPALQDLAAGLVQLGFAPANVAVQYAQKGWATPIALTGQRNPMLSNVPTFSEQGFTGPIERSSIWFGLVGPKGLPDETLKRWYGAIGDALRTPEFTRFLATTGYVPFMSTPRQFSENLAREFTVTNQLIRKLGIQAE